MQSTKIQSNKSLKEISTFGIGANASYYTECRSEEEMIFALQFAAQKCIPHLIIGKGSNVLFPDHNIDALVIQNRIEYCTICGTKVAVGSGYSFSLLGMRTAKQNLAGLEFASGIPASVGGAVFMNAGAKGIETKDVLASVTYLHENGMREVFTKENLSFSYRSSSFQRMKGVIIDATFSLWRDDEARKRQLEITRYRMHTQPLHDKSAGCVFRNPEGNFASKLIDECGLKGTRIGGAEVSSKHANFIVNRSEAKQKDVLDLMEYIQDVVYEKKGVRLEKEIRIIDETISC